MTRPFKVYLRNGNSYRTVAFTALVDRSMHRTVELGRAVLWAHAARVEMRGTNLRGAVLSGADLRGAGLFDCDLADADLRGAELRGAELSGVDLRGADLRHAELHGARLAGCFLDGSIPVVPNVHAAVYAAASRPGALDMDDWHRCATTHCRAGWVTTLAGADGSRLEQSHGVATAAALIYQASDPTLRQVPDFYAGNAQALEDMRLLAGAEAST